MRQRLISAAVLVPVVVIVFVLGNPWLTFGLALLAGMAAYETSHLVRRAGLETTSSVPVIAAALAVGLTSFVLGGAETRGPGIQPLTAQTVVAPVVGLFALIIGTTGLIGLRRRDPASGFRVWVGNAFAALYPSMLAFAAAIVAVAPSEAPGSALAGLFDSGRVWLLILVATVWSFDTLAYLAGRFHGRGRFMSHISPNKTWSGVVGGTVGAVAVCAALVWAAGHNPLGGLLLGLVIALAAQAGDLAESMLKRAADAKDSGNLLPGHGGVLDRVDSFLFAAPAMFVVLTSAQLLIGSTPT